MVARRGVKRNVPCSCKGGNGGKEGSFRVGHRGGISRNFSYLALFLVPPLSLSAFKVYGETFDEFATFALSKFSAVPQLR